MNNSTGINYNSDPQDCIVSSSIYFGTQTPLLDGRVITMNNPIPTHTHSSTDLKKRKWNLPDKTNTMLFPLSHSQAISPKRYKLDATTQPDQSYLLLSHWILSMKQKLQEDPAQFFPLNPHYDEELSQLVNKKTLVEVLSIVFNFHVSLNVSFNTTFRACLEILREGSFICINDPNHNPAYSEYVGWELEFFKQNGMILQLPINMPDELLAFFTECSSILQIPFTTSFFLNSTDVSSLDAFSNSSLFPLLNQVIPALNEIQIRIVEKFPSKALKTILAKLESINKMTLFFPSVSDLNRYEWVAPNELLELIEQLDECHLRQMPGEAYSNTEEIIKLIRISQQFKQAKVLQDLESLPHYLNTMLSEYSSLKAMGIKFNNHLFNRYILNSVNPSLDYLYTTIEKSSLSIENISRIMLQNPHVQILSCTLDPNEYYSFEQLSELALREESKLKTLKIKIINCLKDELLNTTIQEILKYFRENPMLEIFFRSSKSRKFNRWFKIPNESYIS